MLPEIQKMLTWSEDQYRIHNPIEYEIFKNDYELIYDKRQHQDGFVFDLKVNDILLFTYSSLSDMCYLLHNNIDLWFSGTDNGYVYYKVNSCKTQWVEGITTPVIAKLFNMYRIGYTGKILDFTKLVNSYRGWT